MSNSLATTKDGGHFRPVVDYIARVQHSNGLIPWYPGGPSDPWDHVESAMGLTIGGRHKEAVDAYNWLAETQLEDGSWWAVYGPHAENEGSHREPHRSAYVATGVWHHFCATDDLSFLGALWPTVERALEFAIEWQHPTGEIPWAIDSDGQPVDAALITGCSSLAFSLECGIQIAVELGYDRPRWEQTHGKLCEAIRRPSSTLETRWMDKSEFAMDWFYPVLSGVITGSTGRDRLNAREDEFLEPGLGCRCDETEAWVTVAETAELVMALLAVGWDARAAQLFEWAGRWRDAEGVFWTGYQFVDDELWPPEQPTWTSAAVLLAADALDGLTSASDLFTSHENRQWQSTN